MSQQNSVGSPQSLEKDIVIIGTGFGGLGMAIKLKEAGYHNFVILEKADRVGGCWRENTYPGAACDVPSNLYSYSFESKPDWSRRFAPHHEIAGYLKHCADKYELNSHIQFNTTVESAQFDETVGQWTLKTNNDIEVRARIFISACGQLSQPSYPSIEGMDKFQGKVMHSASWDHDYDLTGKTVAVIGTGASAIQFVPEVAKKVKSLRVFQRTAPYVMAKPDRAYTVFEKAMFKVLPFTQKLSRLNLYLLHEVRFLSFSSLQSLMFLGRAVCAWNLKKTIKDPELRKKLSPDYPIGCNRILISSNYYDAYNQNNVQLETSAIAGIDEKGVIMKDGAHHAVDAIIYGTGFKATEFLSPMEISGLKGKKLNEEWKDGAESYLGMTVKDFPNLYMLYGPNTNLGHNSIIYMLESQIKYALESVKALYKNNLKYLNTRSDIQTIFNARIQEQVKNTVWDKDCNSWYRTTDGRNTNNWPDFTFRYRKMTRDVNLNDFDAVAESS